MKHIRNNQSSRIVRVLLAISLMVTAGCAQWTEWNSTPARVQADYGASVRNMVNNQIYNPDKAQHPATLSPDGMEGNKGDTVLEQTYRNDIGSPKYIKSHSTLGTPGLQGGGGAAR